MVEVSQFGGRYGKTSDNTTSGDGDIENGDGISHRKDGGLKVEFNWEKQSNNTYKVFKKMFNKLSVSSERIKGKTRTHN